MTVAPPCSPQVNRSGDVKGPRNRGPMETADSHPPGCYRCRRRADGEGFGSEAICSGLLWARESEMARRQQS
jgi:hypothetical protein